MKKTIRRIISILLSGSIACSVFPFHVWADTAEGTISGTAAEHGSVLGNMVIAEERAVTGTQDDGLISTSPLYYTYTVVDGTFCEITGYTGAEADLVIPGEIDGYTVKTIGAEAFRNNRLLSTLEFPGTVETIGSQAFAGCTALTDIVFGGGLQNIESFAFQYCSALESVDIPDSVTSIASRAFYQCTELSEVGYPAGWTTVPDINNETKLDDGSMYYKSPFDGCIELKEITVDEGVTCIPKHAFLGMTSLDSIDLPSTLTSIGAYAFAGCTALKAVSFPQNLLEIGGSAFWQCSSLTSLTLPEKMSVAANRAFSGCSSLKEVNFPSGLQAIQSFAFQGCSALESVDIPDSVTSIASRAFYQCTELSEVGYPAGWTTVPDINNETKLADGDMYYKSPFDGCIELKKIKVDEGVTCIPKHAFKDMLYLESIDLPSTLTSIGAYAFDGCSGLNAVMLPEGLTEINEGAFRKCTGFTYFYLPGNLEVLGSKAFAGCSSLQLIEIPDSLTALSSLLFYDCSKLAYINLPSSLTSIGGYAFSGCKSLVSLYVPDSIAGIGEHAFHNTDNLTFYCNASSYAAVYAVSNGIPVMDLEGGRDAGDFSLDRTRSYYRVNLDRVSASGYLDMAVNYAFKSPEEISDVKIILNIPSSAELIESTIRVKDAVCTDYTYKDGVLTIPCGNESGTVRFFLKPLAYAKIMTYAAAAFRKDSVMQTEVIGTAVTELPMLSISCRTETSSADVTVTGAAVPGSTVDLYVDGVRNTAVTVNKAGDYSAKLSLGELKSGKKYDLRAVTTYEGTEIAAETTAVYRDDIPMVTQFVMEHNGQVFRIEEDSGYKPVVFFNPAKSFRFIVKFDHPESIGIVYVVSSRNGIKKCMQAKWSSAAQGYVAEGYFDLDNPSYVPGTISVEYVHGGSLISFDGEYDFGSAENINDIPDGMLNADIVVNEMTDEKMDISITLPDNGGRFDLKSRYFDIPDGVTESNAEAKGYTKVTDDYGNDAYAKYYERRTGDILEVGYEYIVFGFGEASQKAVEYTIKRYLGDTAGANAGTLLSGSLAAFEMLDAFKQGSVFYDDYRAVKYSIDTLETDPARREALQNLLNDVIMYNAATTVLRWAGTAVSVAAGVTMGPLPALIVGIGMKAFDQIYDITQRQLANQIQDLLKMLQKNSYGFRWAIDPSGYVYDETTDALLDGVTATVYWLPYDADDSGYWESVPDDSEHGVIWDASEYSQYNPLITDADGYYAWDVPEGWWRVRYEKEGYETAWSEWLAVPPPRTDVNIGMMPCVPADKKLVGTVTSWNTKEDIVLALYPAEAKEADIAADIRLDEPAGMIAVTTTATVYATDASGRYTQEYSFDSVQAGSYQLAVYKPGIHSAVITKVEITDTVLTLNTIDLRLLGDINADGNISFADSGLFAQYYAGQKNGNLAMTVDAADTDRDGTVTRADGMILVRYLAGWHEYSRYFE